MRSQRLEIQRRRRTLHEQLRALSFAPLMRGSVYERRRRCGRKGCACATDADALHAGTFLTVFVAGRTQGFNLRAEDEEYVRGAVAAYERVWKLINELTACEVSELRRQVRERRRERGRRKA
jgi:hypothetical protein